MNNIKLEIEGKFNIRLLLKDSIAAIKGNLGIKNKYFTLEVKKEKNNGEVKITHHQYFRKIADDKKVFDLSTLGTRVFIFDTEDCAYVDASNYREKKIRYGKQILQYELEPADIFEHGYGKVNYEIESLYRVENCRAILKIRYRDLKADSYTKDEELTVSCEMYDKDTFSYEDIFIINDKIYSIILYAHKAYIAVYEPKQKKK